MGVRAGARTEIERLNLCDVFVFWCVFFLLIAVSDRGVKCVVGVRHGLCCRVVGWVI